jgi:hypothetical protein
MKATTIPVYIAGIYKEAVIAGTKSGTNINYSPF